MTVMLQGHRALKIGLLVILLVGSIAAQPGFAKGGKGNGRVLAKSAARPFEAGAKQTPQSQRQGPAKADTVHAPVDKPSDIDTRITIQPRRLGKSLNPNTRLVKPFSLANPYHQRTLSALPRAPYSPARSAIGLPISPRISAGSGDGLHPRSPTA